VRTGGPGEQGGCIGGWVRGRGSRETPEGSWGVQGGCRRRRNWGAGGEDLGGECGRAECRQGRWSPGSPTAVRGDEGHGERVRSVTTPGCPQPCLASWQEAVGGPRATPGVRTGWGDKTGGSKTLFGGGGLRRRHPVLRWGTSASTLPDVWSKPGCRGWSEPGSAGVLGLALSAWAGCGADGGSSNGWGPQGPPKPAQAMAEWVSIDPVLVAVLAVSQRGRGTVPTTNRCPPRTCPAAA